ncbi:hypothetical protein CMTB2_04007 [Caminibacter mediatlanticus TB-2]|uniref:Uncharacterized protein n=1 Tax=Caminibacter mediatlanticus TB-2 TaxID=391592 RepID=A0AAI9AFW7_9BACT|nr:hypothetical protein CMTB2_04007 [Caminibacter mediatlanticus TB-2]
MDIFLQLIIIKHLHLNEKVDVVLKSENIEISNTGI